MSHTPNVVPCKRCCAMPTIEHTYDVGRGGNMQVIYCGKCPTNVDSRYETAEEWNAAQQPHKLPSVDTLVADAIAASQQPLRNVSTLNRYNLASVPDSLRLLAQQIELDPLMAERCVVVIEPASGAPDYRAFGADPFPRHQAAGLAFWAGQRIAVGE